MQVKKLILVLILSLLIWLMTVSLFISILIFGVVSFAQSNPSFIQWLNTTTAFYATSTDAFTVAGFMFFVMVSIFSLTIVGTFIFIFYYEFIERKVDHFMNW